MKKLFTLLTVMLLGVSTWSCSYDDDDLWNEIGNIKTELAHFNSYIASGDSFPAASITRNVRKRTIFPKNHCIFVCLE